MSRRVFISFRYNDGHKYKDYLSNLFSKTDTVINCSESQDRSNMSEDTIKRYLYNKLKNTSVTIVLLTPDAVNHKKQPNKPYFDLTWFDDGDIPLTDVWRNSITTIKERENTGGHATPKPLKICERGIVTSTKVGEIVLDLFGGSGSTLIACEQLGRKCYMMELDPKYCDVIMKRWETLTGKKAKLIVE